MPNDKEIERVVDKLHEIAIRATWRGGTDGEEDKELIRSTLTNLLTQYHQDLINEERERIASLCYQLDTDGEKMYQLIYKEDSVAKE